MDKSVESLPCIVCNKVLYCVYGNDSYQPDNAVICSTKGNYGSEVFDAGELGESLIFNICDDCLFAAKGKGIIKKEYVILQPSAVEYKDWE